MTYLVVSGLPASGKSTLARQLGPLLGLEVLDKDEILESLFELRGVGGTSWRAQLSRAADEILAERARTLAAAIVVSWWHHPGNPPGSGTPTDWLLALPGGVLEIHCECAPETAASRFMARRRHAGHLDRDRAAADIVHEFMSLAQAGPLGVGPVITVVTEADVDVAGVAARVQSY